MTSFKKFIGIALTMTICFFASSDTLPYTQPHPNHKVVYCCTPPPGWHGEEYIDLSA
ncbi:9148_t:CDS:2 [Ambispora leptoticha]|uniref:9148_t:CDS:1 n=1 Tax=Ambispora leptoticha TaxID=144679 RepID=A0A9N9BD21_9GLOM|nr:9148_t:CDS:2 [Ambispora leptoticha]